MANKSRMRNLLGKIETITSIVIKRIRYWCYKIEGKISRVVPGQFSCWQRSP